MSRAAAARTITGGAGAGGSNKQPSSKLSYSDEILGSLGRNEGTGGRGKGVGNRSANEAMAGTEPSREEDAVRRDPMEFEFDRPDRSMPTYAPGEPSSASRDFMFAVEEEIEKDLYTREPGGPQVQVGDQPAGDYVQQEFDRPIIDMPAFTGSFTAAGSQAAAGERGEGTTLGTGKNEQQQKAQPSKTQQAQPLGKHRPDSTRYMYHTSTVTRLKFRTPATSNPTSSAGKLEQQAKKKESDEKESKKGEDAFIRPGGWAQEPARPVAGGARAGGTRSSPTSVPEQDVHDT